MPLPPVSPSPGEGSSPSSGSRWVVLRRKACIEPDLPQGTGCCLAIGERPPGLTNLLVSPLVTSYNGADVRDPFVVVADSSGILLLAGSPDGEPLRTCYFLCDAVSNTVRQLPGLSDCCNPGLIVSGDPSSDFVVADLPTRTWMTPQSCAASRPRLVATGSTRL
ncbi:hypothetical protein PR202_gb27240 [Eleusine coracana subsp. coracana]|uniref:Uncharacterized protein n=1 Tax=Eleusine coracana subsp. coracana TaxID=191504 RepID=A0AAV5FU73_ELECO|nr:hypothetical protein PR202_gb27240 [Eleusine coracana subsp. coracana]